MTIHPAAPIHPDKFVLRDERKNWFTQTDWLSDARFLEKFWSKVDKSPGQGPHGDCWEWRRGKSNGYGEFKRVRTTHISLHIDGRPREAGLLALHSCDNPPCVNPAHLRWGTNLENNLECLERGRHASSYVTHCRMGHPLSGENLMSGVGQRRCRTCSIARKGKYRNKINEPAFSNPTFEVVKSLASKGMDQADIQKELGLSISVVSAYYRSIKPMGAFCRSGHEYALTGVYITSAGHRQCLACKKAWLLKSTAQKSNNVIRAESNNPIVFETKAEAQQHIEAVAMFERSEG